MKNILVPTDFSHNAQVSAYYAAAFARLTGARLIIFHAFYPLAIPMGQGTGTPEKIDSLLPSDDPQAAAQEQLDLLAYELHTAFGVSVTRLLKPGFAADEIPVFARRLRADLVVMGIQGSNLQLSGTMGKVAGVMLLSESVPVVCVPAEAGLSTQPSIQQFLKDRCPLCNNSGQQILQALASQSGLDLQPVGGGVIALNRDH
ncbi:universal stress protein [Cesiribacter sp. SM1]|uniref:universal stress protein n=1 Tax=Cesiribacter sp. SM1 TaxID=2861196 RepID=UPI001CD5AFD9|nr:universal stress protein [Cesiribacter sp. SM1]